MVHKLAKMHIQSVFAFNSNLSRTGQAVRESCGNLSIGGLYSVRKNLKLDRKQKHFSMDSGEVDSLTRPNKQIKQTKIYFFLLWSFRWNGMAVKFF